MGEANASFLSSVYWVDSQSFQVNEILGNLADLVWKDEKCSPDEP